jgi:hypothetical protein
MTNQPTILEAVDNPSPALANPAIAGCATRARSDERRQWDNET